MSAQFQALSDSVYATKYQLTDKNGNKIDKNRFDTFRRVAKALVEFEKDQEFWEDEFYQAMCCGAIPAGRITSNAGAGEHKPNTSLINCIVSDTILDSIEGIGQAVKDSLLSLSTGSGIGYCFSTLRPKGSYVSGVGASTSGALPFADIFDKGCSTIASAGGRRGAQMATFDLRHPDVLDFIKVKREDGRFRQFNISALVPNHFFNDEKTWKFRFPLRKTDPFVDQSKTCWDYWHVNDEHYTKNEAGLTLFKNYGEIDKQELWDLVLKSNYDYAEPGILLIDKINSENNLWFCEEIVATNPCLAQGTLVKTINGLVPIEDVVVGDKVLTDDTCYREITEIEVHEQTEIFRVTLENGVSVLATRAHIFHVQELPDRWTTDLRLDELDLEVHKLRILNDTDGSSSAVAIESIIFEGYTTVYDLYEPITDSWVTENGLVSRGCGEQPLPPKGACLLGSIDLTHFVSNSFTDAARFDHSLFTSVVRTFTRLLDNVVEFNNLPLPAQQEEIYRKRRHGMGFFGLGSALTMLGIPYNSHAAQKFAEAVAMEMAIEGFTVGVELAKEKGPAPIMEESFTITPEMSRFNTFAQQHIGETFTGKELFAKSNYMQRLFQAKPSLEKEILEHGCRFTHHSSIAPTGTISLAMGNGASGGVEPSFAHHYFRNVTVEGKKTRQQESVYSKEFLVYKALDSNAGKSDEELLNNLPDYFITADSISWKAHVDMLAAIQPWVDSSISKTINLPTDIPFEEFKNVYNYAYSVGCKAVSTYRYNPETLGSILSRTDDLEKTRYEFTLQDGTVLVCKGSDQITYDGESTSADNLFNALKEKTYGKF